MNVQKRNSEDRERQGSRVNSKDSALHEWELENCSAVWKIYKASQYPPGTMDRRIDTLEKW